MLCGAGPEVLAVCTISGQPEPEIRTVFFVFTFGGLFDSRFMCNVSWVCTYIALSEILNK